MKDWRVLIKNTNTHMEKWYTCPLDKETIYNELKLNSDNYVILKTDAPAPVHLCESIDQIITEYNSYLLLPELIQKHINIIAIEFDYIADTLTSYEIGRIELYPGVTSKKEYVTQYLKDNHIIPTDMIEYIDYNKYFEHLSEKLNIYMFTDGVVVIKN